MTQNGFGMNSWDDFPLVDRSLLSTEALVSSSNNVDIVILSSDINID